MTEEIKKLYEEVADKTLRKWCIWYFIDFHTWEKERYELIWNWNWYSVEIWEYDLNIDDTWFTIIGHPIMIGNCLDWLEKNKYTISVKYDWEWVVWDLFYKWKDKTKDIQAPENKEALDYMINLVLWHK
jgi:hypothetical protein